MIDAQAELVAHWMLVGFVHGVLNTDNVTISGEGIDYGPCAFIDRFDPTSVFSSIDHGGRYAYRNQPGITLWNLSRFAETLLPLIDADIDTAVSVATDALHTFEGIYQQKWRAGMAAKLGLDASASDRDPDLFDDYLALLHELDADYTSSFVFLADHLRNQESANDSALAGSAMFDAWQARWRNLIAGTDVRSVADRMDEVNPRFIPRNHLVERALDAATEGDLTPFGELLDVVTRPFETRNGLEAFAAPAPAEFADTFQTFCGT